MWKNYVLLQINCDNKTKKETAPDDRFTKGRKSFT